MPSALNCCVCFRAIEALGGVTEILFSVAAVTVSVVLAEPALELAVIVVDPTPAALNSPGVPVAFATAALPLVQVTVPDNGADVPSENSCVAVKSTVCPTCRTGLAGVTIVAVATFVTIVTL